MLLENAFVLAIVTFVGGYLVWKKLPKRLRRWLLRLNLATDIILLFAAYIVLGGTATALLAASMVE